MRAAEIGRRYVDFFAARDHTVVPSASLLYNDPTLLFVNAHFLLVAAMAAVMITAAGREVVAPQKRRFVTSRRVAETQNVEWKSYSDSRSPVRMFCPVAREHANCVTRGDSTERPLVRLCSLC